jgi:UDP-GlcNAc:undecaprenyl-phosphate GlcNAc-1-phosphate transferase
MEIFLFLFAGSFILALSLTTFFIYFAPRLGFTDLPGDRKIHQQAVPYGGGVAIFITIYGLLLLAWVLLNFVDMPNLPKIIKEHFKGLQNSKVNMQLIGILIGGLVVFLTGLIDDIKGLGPLVKLAAGFAASGIVIYTGTCITGLSTLLSDTMISHMIPAAFLNWAVTAIWIVGITNAFNLLDNMDGLCSGVAIIISGILMLICFQSGQIFICALIILFLGAVSGFWVYNYNPAKIFLGDSGSLLIGYFLSIITILPTFYHSLDVSANVLSVFMPLIILSVPIFDTCSVIWIRLRQKKSIFIGDTNHFSHRLVKLGLSRQQAVLLIYLVCISTGISSLLLFKLNTFGASLLFLQVILVFLIIVILENASRNKKVSE